MGKWTIFHFASMLKHLLFLQYLLKEVEEKTLFTPFFQSGVEVSHLVPHSQLLRQCEIQAQLMFFFGRINLKKNIKKT
jgi:hypothetical protein